jgi:hypothetical protein
MHWSVTIGILMDFLQKIPTLIQLLFEQESRDQVDKLDNIRCGKQREVPCENVWVPDIPFTYGEFKEKAAINKMTEITNMPTTKNAAKRRKKDKVDVIVEVGKKQSTLTPINENGCPKRKINHPKKSI